jgi:large subunit ribosomal protein L30
MAKFFSVTLTKSLIGCTQRQKDAVRCLGLKRRHHTVKLADNPATRGQIVAVQHLIDVKVEK